jgi:hypothetical protein
MPLRNSYHFVDANELPRVEGSTTFAQAYEQLATETNGGGFIMKTYHRDVYVKAAALAGDILRRAIVEVLLDRPLSADEQEMVRLKMEQITNKPIAELVDQAIREAAVVAVHHEPILLTVAADELGDQYDRVFDVQEDGQTVGWHLNHETVRDTTTQKTIFVCGNPTPHKNTSPDHGTCNYCPWPIVKTRTE